MNAEEAESLGYWDVAEEIRKSSALRNADIERLREERKEEYEREKRKRLKAAKQKK